MAGETGVSIVPSAEALQTLSVNQLLRNATEWLSNSPTARLDAELMLCYVMKVERASFYANPQQQLSAVASAEMSDLLRARASGVPMAYLLGERAFWSLSLQVNDQVLIPRPETELLVELAVAQIVAKQQHRPNQPVEVVDVGTGSGAVAIALAQACQAAEVLALDRSVSALQVARENADRYQCQRVRLMASDLLTALHPEKRVDIIVSNPPYLRQDDPHLSMGDLRFEPQLALVGGETGLELIARLIQAATAHLLPGGGLMLEHGFDQGDAVRALLRAAGFEGVRTYQDLAGLDRVSVGDWNIVFQ